MIISRENNFDLLRLFAALEVVLGHASAHLNIGLGAFGNILSHFPGVPVFFTISGFLIARSFSLNQNIKQYFRNRILRIYPALWCCLLFTVILMLVSNGISYRQIFSKNMILWFFGQATFFQYWTPDILRGWGVSAPNGSLWTIPVEIQFYILLPVIVLLFKKIPIFCKIILLFALSFLVNRFCASFHHSGVEPTLIKLIGVSVFPHLFNFLLGAIMYYYWDTVRKYIENKALFWILLYIGYTVVFEQILSWYHFSYYPSVWGLISTSLLAVMTISMAFTCKDLSHRILKGNDISYGVYIYHMPILNLFLSVNVQDKLLISENMTFSGGGVIHL
jgi:peptidoglycan/LPS O-acetylase OafA/YrhL